MTVEFSEPTKAAVTVAEMARMVGLSRARFYQLLGTTFPFPVYDVSTRRPIFVEEQQRVCLEVRRRNCGIDGKPILFYARRGGSLPPDKSRTKKPKPKRDEQFAALAAALKSLGLSAVSAADVRSAVAVVFPNGIAGIDGGQVIRAVFLHLKRRDSGDSVGR
jgi:hypothetical protein